jgi:hypothetical protein
MEVFVPKVNGKRFPYTTAGKKAATAYAKKKKSGKKVTRKKPLKSR